jgi:GT2 family glycosyltransferase
MSRTAVVILNYNGEKLLQKFLPSVVQYSAEAEIIVADNNSSDKSIAFVRQTFPDIRIIQLDRNYGYCGGYNRAISQVDTDYVVLLNSDIEATPNWLNPMVDMLDRDETIAAVQPKVLSYNKKSHFEHAGAGGGFIDAFGYPFCRGRVFDHVEVDEGQYNDTREVFWASGACLMIRTQSFKKFGGFDEDFFAHMEEIDLCWKLNRAGQRIFYCGASTIYHVGAGTLAYRNPTKTYLNFGNGLSMLLKHLGFGEALYKMPLRIILDWIAALQFLVTGDGKNFLAVLRAHGRFIITLPVGLRKRRELRKLYPRYNDAMIYGGSIVVHYYLRGKKDSYAPASAYQTQQHAS